MGAVPPSWPGILSHAVGDSRVKNWRRSPAETILGVKNAGCGSGLTMASAQGVNTLPSQGHPELELFPGPS